MGTARVKGSSAAMKGVLKCLLFEGDSVNLIERGSRDDREEGIVQSKGSKHLGPCTSREKRDLHT